MLGASYNGKTTMLNTAGFQTDNRSQDPPATREDIRFGQIKTNNDWQNYQLHEVGGNMPAEYRITNVYPRTDAFMVVY